MLDLFLYTASFPYKAESFLENEMPILSKKFSNIYISTIFYDSSKREVPQNSKVLFSLNGRKDIKTMTLFMSNFFFIGKVLSIEFLGCRNKIYFLANIRKFISQLLRAIYDVEKLKEEYAKIKSDVVHYSFWMNDWALALAVAKEKKLINQFVFRCGGFDIYDERHSGNYLPFRYFIYKNASAVFPNSNFGKSYLINLNVFPEKIKTSYWATHNYGANMFEPNQFTLVSCSRVIPLKRIHLIIEILKKIPFEMKWVHLGGGECLKDIIQWAQALPNNVKTEFIGEVTNQEVIAYYKNNSISMFITTSETEGLPVSIQEAISFGIPVIGTDVGGISEVVNEKTGFLISRDFNCEEVAKLIIDFKNGNKNSIDFRKTVRDFWSKNFEATTLYNQFSEELYQYKN